MNIINKILNGYEIQGDEAHLLLDMELEELCQGANQIREKYCGNNGDICSIISGKCGKCSEDCGFCAQSGSHNTEIKAHNFLPIEKIVRYADENAKLGIHRYSIVTAGRRLKGEDFENAIKAFERISRGCNIECCASLGLLDDEQFHRLKAAGVKRYHANIETSERYFENICTTHKYEDKIKCIIAAQNAGLEVCSGGIFGMGESWSDRIDMAIALRELKIMSIPLNFLIPIKNTPMEKRPSLNEDEILRIAAVFRCINPRAQIRIAAGRVLMNERGKKLFTSGANATITGDMLTTTGASVEEDIKMLMDLGFDIKGDKVEK